MWWRVGLSVSTRVAEPILVLCFGEMHYFKHNLYDTVIVVFLWFGLVMPPGQGDCLRSVL